MSLTLHNPIELHHAFIWKEFQTGASMPTHCETCEFLCGRTGRVIFTSERRNEKMIVWAYSKPDSQIHPSKLESWWDQSQKMGKLECRHKDGRVWEEFIEFSFLFIYHHVAIFQQFNMVIKGAEKRSQPYPFVSPMSDEILVGMKVSSRSIDDISHLANEAREWSPAHFQLKLNRVISKAEKGGDYPIVPSLEYNFYFAFKKPSVTLLCGLCKILVNCNYAPLIPQPCALKISVNS